MSEKMITKDAASLLSAIYKAYKKRKRSGQPKQNAVILGSSSDIRQEIMSQWSLEDINEACWELHDAELLECLPGDDSVQMAILTKAGIAYSESRITGILKSFWGLLKELLPFIP